MNHKGNLNFKHELKNLEVFGIESRNHKLKICLIFLTVKQIQMNSVFEYFLNHETSYTSNFSFSWDWDLGLTYIPHGLTSKSLGSYCLPHHPLEGTDYKICSCYETLAFIFPDSKQTPTQKHLGII